MGVFTRNGEFHVLTKPKNCCKKIIIKSHLNKKPKILLSIRKKEIFFELEFLLKSQKNMKTEKKLGPPIKLNNNISKVDK